MSKSGKMTIAEFKKRFYALRKKGYVRAVRGGPTGVGHTLEHELGLTENNVAAPDIGVAEIKAHRVNSTSLVTLFTFNRKVWRMKQIDAIRKYGTPDENGRLGLYFTMTATPNSAGLFVRFEENSIDLRHIDGTLVASWLLADIADEFEQKIPMLIYVSAHVEERSRAEYFHYRRARLLAGLSREGLRSTVENGAARFDIRQSVQTRPRLTDESGLRVQDGELPSIFARVTDL